MISLDGGIYLDSLGVRSLPAVWEQVWEVVPPVEPTETREH